MTDVEVAEESKGTHCDAYKSRRASNYVHSGHRPKRNTCHDNTVKLRPGTKWP